MTSKLEAVVGAVSFPRGNDDDTAKWCPEPVLCFSIDVHALNIRESYV